MPLSCSVPLHTVESGQTCRVSGGWGVLRMINDSLDLAVMIASLGGVGRGFARVIAPIRTCAPGRDFLALSYVRPALNPAHSRHSAAPPLPAGLTQGATFTLVISGLSCPRRETGSATTLPPRPQTITAYTYKDPEHTLALRQSQPRGPWRRERMAKPKCSAATSPSRLTA